MTRSKANNAEAQKTLLHAWKAGPETVALRQQLEAMRDGGVYILSIPKAPYRCPPGPYERACQVAFYFKQAKPRSKVLILDANEDVTSKPALFKAAWNELYKGHRRIPQQQRGKIRGRPHDDGERPISTASRAMCSTCCRRCARATSPAPPA